MIGRESQIVLINKTLKQNKSSFIAFTGRRRVGKTYIINQAYKDYMSLKVTGIQNADLETQIVNFTQKIAEYSNQQIVTVPNNWQEVFLLLKNYLKTLPKNKKQVIVIDELPWICNAKSGFLQLLAHLWNDYLSTEKHFILVICGSATSWITQKIINDKGGLHNRVTQSIHLEPFTLKETKQFLDSKKIGLTNNSIVEIYMTMGGIPYYLEDIQRGESSSTAIERMCFENGGILKNEYQNLYKALFENPQNHEAIVSTLAMVKSGMTQNDLILKSKVQKGGPFTRAMNDLLMSGFVTQDAPFGKLKRGSVYRLVDEFSVFHHRFIKPNSKAPKEIWQTISASQPYKIWKGFAFETLCQKHVAEIKNALGIRNVYTQTNSFVHQGTSTNSGFQIDLLIDRKDASINLCECKFYDASFEIDKKYAMTLLARRAIFRETVKTKKNIFNTMITNYPMTKNAYSLDCVDVQITIDDLM